jgi:DNA-binding IscR family transcriptional regulator
MQISKKFTIAIHLLTASRYFEGQQKITSRFLAGSIGTNPVIVRNIMLQLQEAGLIDVKRGPGGSYPQPAAFQNYIPGHL